jgi:hypothetical protein
MQLIASFIKRLTGNELFLPIPRNGLGKEDTVKFCKIVKRRVFRYFHDAIGSLSIIIELLLQDPRLLLFLRCVLVSDRQYAISSCVIVYIDQNSPYYPFATFALWSNCLIRAISQSSHVLISPSQSTMHHDGIDNKHFLP